MHKHSVLYSPPHLNVCIVFGLVQRDRQYATLHSVLCNLSFRTIKWVSRNGWDALSRKSCSKASL